MRHALGLSAAAAALLLGAEAPAQGPPAGGRERRAMPENSSVYIISPRNCATVRSPVTVRMGLVNAGVAPAGVSKANTGHHHLFIDADVPRDLGQELPPTGPHVMHFGLGQTETRINLPPGRHTLQLVLADEDHVPHDPPLISRKVVIYVPRRGDTEPHNPCG